MRIHPARIAAPALLVGLSLLLIACGANVTQPTATPSPPPPSNTPTPLQDAGPNAGSSNAALLTKALANMDALTSYHEEFTGPLQWSADTVYHLVLTQDVQLAKGRQLHLTEQNSASDVIMRRTRNGWYYSYDQGTTWSQPQGDTQEAYLLLALEWRWALGEANDSRKHPDVAAFHDGDPRLAQVDGVVTRHMVADFGQVYKPSEFGTLAGFGKLTAIHFWVSTELTPTIRQVQLDSQVRNPVSPAISLAYSPDGNLLAVAHGGAPPTIRVWDLRHPGSVPTRLHTNSKGDWFAEVTISPDGQWIAAAGREQVYLWPTARLDTPPTILPAAKDVRSVAFGSGGALLAAATTTGIYLWSAPYSGSTPRILPQPAETVAFSPDNATLATSDLHKILLYDLRHLDAPPATLAVSQIRQLAFSPDHHWLAGMPLGGSGQLRVWDLRQAPPALIWLGGNSSNMDAVTFSPDGRFLVTTGRYDFVAFWDLQTPAPLTDAKLSTYHLVGGQGAWALAFSPDGKQLAVPDTDGTVGIWPVDQLPRTNFSSATPTLAPTILQDQEHPLTEPSTITWKWSRFNEDLGEVLIPQVK